MLKQLRQAMFLGFLVILPLFVTVYLIQLVLGLADRLIGNWLTQLFVSLEWASQKGATIFFMGFPFHHRIPLIGLLFLLLLLLFVGGLARTVMGQHLFRGLDQLIGLIPVARGIYLTVQQVTHAFVHEKSTFKEVVLVEYPRKGVFTVGFITGESQGSIQMIGNQEFVNVFLPKSPNPTNGWLALVPREEVQYLDLPIEEGLRFVISGGVVPPKAKQHLPDEY